MEVTNIMLHVGLGHQLYNVWYHTNVWGGVTNRKY